MSPNRDHKQHRPPGPTRSETPSKTSNPQMPSPKQARNEPNKTISFTVLTCIVIYFLCIPIETTSNIRPTWRSGTPSHKDDDPHQDDKRLPRNADYETTSLASNVSASIDHLRASSSSLQPAIVDLPNRQQAQRRSSQPVQFKLAHLSPTSSNAANITDEASSLDHWWSQQGLANSSLLPLLNEQVHFDEEHHTGGANNNNNTNYNREEDPSSSAAKRSRRIAGNQHRRQDAADDQPTTGNDDVNLSNLSPKHAEDNQQHLFDQVQQRPPRNNSMEPVYQDNKATGNNRSSFSGSHDQDNLFDSTPDLVHSNAAALELNKTSNARRSYNLDAQNNNSLEFHPPSHHYEPQSIYYLPNGDKWNSASFHNSNEQQDLQTTTKAYEPLVATTTPARRRPINRAAHNPMNSMQNDDRLHQHQPDRLSYGFVPSKASSQEQPLVDWPRTAPNLVQRHQMPVRLGQHPIQQVPRRHPQPLLGASSPPRRQQLIRVGEIPASQLLLNNINDRQLLNAARQHNQQQRLMLASPRPRKSLLGSLGEKLNTWTSSNGAEHSQLENYFYEPSSGAYTRDNNRYRQQATIAKRPIRLASTANKWPLQQHQHQQPPNYFYSRPQRAPQSVQHNPAAMFYNNNRVMQPTVAPAASTLNQLYGHRGPHLMSRQQQQPANFIPVVAVQMTQTSPAPNGGNVRPLSPDEANQVQAGAPEMTSSEIDEYLEAKTGQVMGKQQQTSASNRDHSTSQIHDMYRAPGQPAGDHHHTTTVKSAVFGYLPHQAEAPLMQAINMLPQLPTMLSGQQQENYANQMDRSQQSMEATVPFVDQQHQQQSSYPLLEDTQPSLALQLQANSLLHNDIAHPFASPAGSSAAAIRQPQVGLAYPAATLEQMQQLAGLQLNGANQLPSVANGYLMLDSQQAADSAGLFGATNNNNNNNQFYSVAGTSPAMLAGLIPSGSSSVPQLFDPFGGQQANWASSPDFVAGTQNDSPTNGDQTNGESTGGDLGSGQSHDTTLTASANVKNSLKGNRKRSSEFFASAGQLLLSALPLLLAPTLGLMLASSGSSPVARYHGANGIQTAGVPAPGYPSNYMGSLSGGGGDGLVSNSSPHMFTPTPLNYNLGPEYTSTSAPPAPPGSFLKNRSNAGPSTTHSPTPSKRNGQPAPLSALTGLRMTPPTKASTTTTSTTHRPKHAVVLTTLSPPPFSNATNLIASDLATLLSNQTSTHLYIDDDDNNNEGPANQTITAPSTTIFMLTDPNGNQTKLSEQQPDNGGQYYVLATTTKEPVVMEPNGTTLLKSLLDQNNHHYEIGYEGADFDAQFATLVKPSESRTKPPVITYVTTTTTTTTTPKPMRYSLSNNKRYQYSEVSPMNSSLVTEVMPSRRRPVQRLPSPNLVAIHKNSSRFDANEPLETVPPPETPVTELYPVSTWPRSRRKTVSLVTSNGNKTLVDAGDRYHLGSSTSNRAVDGASRDRNRTSSSTNEHRNQVFEVSVTTSNNHQPGGAQRLRTVSTLADSFLLDRIEAPSSLERHKRDLGSATDAIKRKLPRRVKVVKKRVKLKKRRNVTFNLSQVGAAAAAANNQTFGSTGQEHNATTQVTNGHSARRNDHQVEGDLMESQPSLARVQNNNNLTNANNDTMRGDSSRSKSAIVTAMITQVADSGTDEANSLEPEGNYHGVGEDDDDGPEDDPRHLRDQLLRKKILLDRLATRSGSTGRRLALASGSDDYMALGGRAGRVPVPTGSDRVEDVDSATELEEREQQQERRRGQSSARRLSSSALELAEDTKKALAKFGTLLLEDTLQIPGEPTRRRKSSSKLQYRSQSEAPKYQQNYEHSELASATERYSSRLATPAPFEEIETFDNNNSSHLLRPTRVVRDRSHQHHQNYQRARDNGTENDDLYPISQPLGGRYNYSTVGLPARHNEHDYRNNRNTYTTGTNSTSWSSSAGHDMQTRYNRTSDQHPAAPPPPHNDPLDARHSSYTNYTTLAPHYTGPNYHHPSSGYHMDSHAPPPGYSGPPGARRETLPHSHPHSHLSEHYHHQSYPPAPHDYHNHSGHYAPTAYDYSSSSAPPNQRHQPADYHGHSSYDHYSPQAAPPAPPPPPPQQRYHWPPASSPPAEQPTRPPAYNQNEWSTPYQHPAGYSFSPSAPPTAYSFNQQQVAPTPPPPPPPQPPVQGGRTSVNEYLKRVQFSDSDRDKLMASYLTCDGLLNDNDHCLERLSCEFSDPRNIEKANKLDRAVSSILLGHILINTYIPTSFKLRLKSASLFGYTQSGKCSKYACNKLAQAGHKEHLYDVKSASDAKSSSLSSPQSSSTSSTSADDD